MMDEPIDWCYLVLSIFIGAGIFTLSIGAVLYKLAEVGVFP